MCRSAYYHHKKGHPRKGHWLADNAERWARHKGFGRTGFHPPVNIQELDDRYEIFLFAPGLTKEDFQINLKDNILMISAEKKEFREKQENGFWKRKEYQIGGFKRKFELNSKIDLDTIKAKYGEGVLQLTLAKLEDEQTVRKDIFIA